VFLPGPWRKQGHHGHTGVYSAAKARDVLTSCGHLIALTMFVKPVQRADIAVQDRWRTSASVGLGVVFQEATTQT